MVSRSVLLAEMLFIGFSQRSGSRPGQTDNLIVIAHSAGVLSWGKLKELYLTSHGMITRETPSQL